MPGPERTEGKLALPGTIMVLTPPWKPPVLKNRDDDTKI